MADVVPESAESAEAVASAVFVDSTENAVAAMMSRPEFLSKIPNAYMCVKPSSRNQPRHTITN